jgi:hypothetical protein
MRRAILTTAMLAGGLLLASVAAASPGFDMLQFDRAAGDDGARSDRVAPAQSDLMRQWANVGKCVVGRDRNTSMAFVRAPLGSDDGNAAARRLDPVFAGCLAGSRVPGPSSVVLRRAALAKALGIAATRT